MVKRGAMPARRLENVKPSMTMALNEKVQHLLRNGRQVCNLTAGEPDLPTPDEILRKAFEDAREGYTRYTPVAGYPEVREALAQHLSQRWNRDVSPGEVMFTAGAKQGLYNFFMALINPGDEVLIPKPAWVSFPEQVRLAHGVPVFLDTQEKLGWFPSIECLETHRTDRTRALVLNSPNNPTGQLVRSDQLKEIVSWCVNEGIYLVYDETYSELTYPGERHVHPFDLLPDAAPWVITVNAFSKTYRMTGWRIGWVHAPVNWIQTMCTIQSHSTSNPCAISQRAALAALQMPSSFIENQRMMYAERARNFIETLKKCQAFTIVEPRGAFYVWVGMHSILQKRNLDDMELAMEILEQAGVGYVPGSAFSMPGYARFSIAKDIPTLVQAGEALVQYINDIM